MSKSPLGAITRARRIDLSPIPPYAQAPVFATDTRPSYSPGQPPVPASSVQARPALDLSTITAPPATEPEGAVHSALRRALGGFAAGAAATPAGAGYDSGLGGLVGGLSGIAQNMAAERANQLRLAEPRQKLLQHIAQTQAEEAVKDPYRQAEEARRQAGQREAELRRQKFMTDQTLAQAQRTAAESGIPIGDIIKMQDEEKMNLVTRGVMSDDPGYQQMLDTSVRARIEGLKNLGAPVKGLKGSGKTPPPAAPKKRTLDDIFGGSRQ